MMELSWMMPVKWVSASDFAADYPAATEAVWPLPGDPMARYGVRIGEAVRIHGSAKTWWYKGDGMVTCLPEDVPLVNLIPRRFIPWLRRRIAGIPA